VCQWLNNIQVLFAVISGVLTLGVSRI